MPALTVDQIMSDIVLGLASGLDDLLVLELNGRRVLYGVSRAESRLVEIEVASDGQLSLSGSLNLSGSVLVGTSAGIEHGVLPGADALFLSGFSEADGQQVSLSATGTLGAQQSVSGVGLLSSPATLEVSGTPVLMASQTGGGLAHFAYTGGGYATGIGLEDASDRYLADIAAIAPFVVAGTSYVATASATENGVNIASVTETGLTQTGALGAADSLPISTPSDLEVLHRLDETLIVVASVGTSSLSILDVENGVPALADHIYDSAATRFQGASSAATATYGDFAFVAAGGAEGGVSLLTVLPGGRLVHLDSVAEDETVPLDQIASLEAFVAGGALNVVAGADNEVGLTRFAYDLSGLGTVVLAAPDGNGGTGTAGDDQLIGSVVGEPLMGLAGDDILLDGSGNDVLTGGGGADLFVFTADGQTDQITDFERGVDRLDLSGFDFLYDVAQLEIVSTSNGATLNFGTETIFVTTSDAAPLTALDLTTEDILNVDRPPFLLIGREIVGTSADEVLNGGPGDDTIAGAGGADSLTGGAGLDVLLGSSGNDTLDGGSDRDTLIGGTGDDLIFGGDAGDVIYGDDWA